MRLALVAVIVPLLAACTDAAPARSAPTGAVIEVRDAFVVAPPEGKDVTGGGLSVSITGEPQRLVAARTDVAERVELHTMAMEDGMMRMREVESFPVAEGTPLVLERGGDHLMLYGLDPGLKVGDAIDIVLTFENQAGVAQDIVTKAEVVPIGAP